MTDKKVYSVKLTEAELDALVAVISKTRIVDIPLCRVVATHSGLQELKSAQEEIHNG